MSSSIPVVATIKINEDEDDEVIDPKSILKKYNLNVSNVNNKGNMDRTPFKRIDDKYKELVTYNQKNNDYLNYANKTGNTHGLVADEKLKFVSGRDFKKEKTKFKNKTAFGGNEISTNVRSFKLDEDSN